MLDAFLQYKWQLAALFGCLGVCWAISRERPSISAFLAPACLTVSVVLFNYFVLLPKDAQVLRFTAFALGVNWALIVYFWALFVFPPRDLLAYVQWFCVGLIESWGLIASMACNLITMDKSFTDIAAAIMAGESDYACGRDVGQWFEFTPLIIQLAIMAWLVHRFAQARRQADVEFN